MKNFLKKTLRNILVATTAIGAIVWTGYGFGLLVEEAVEKFGVAPTVMGFIAVAIVVISVITAAFDKE